MVKNVFGKRKGHAVDKIGTVHADSPDSVRLLWTWRCVEQSRGACSVHTALQRRAEARRGACSVHTTLQRRAEARRCPC